MGSNGGRGDPGQLTKQTFVGKFKGLSYFFPGVHVDNEHL